MPGQRGDGSFGNYRLERLLGRGGMGEVWLARDRSGSAVALKVLSTTYSADSAYRRRFEREARLGSRLRNPHIVPIHAFGEVDGHLFLEMAYIEGVDLATRLRSGALAPARAVDVVAQAAEALDTAHAAGLVHRDVKPANILEHTSGFVYLIDFGIARAADGTAITASGQVVGTLQYMAPERFTGTLDARSDIYSLACVLYETLTGQVPYGDGDPARQMHAHLTSAPPHASQIAADVPAALDAVIARGMAKDPDDRYASAGQFAAAARAALGVRAPAQPPPVPHGAAGPRPATRVITAPGPSATAAATPSMRARESPAVPPVGPPGPRGNPSIGGWISFGAGVVALAALALWLLVGGIGSGPSPSTTTNEAATSATAPPQTAEGPPYDAADGARDGNFAFTVVDALPSTGPGSPDGADTIVTLTVTNVSGQQQDFRIDEQRLITTEGRSVAPKAADNPSGGNTIPLGPGSTSTIRLAFDVPGDAKKDDKKEDDKKKDDKKREVPSHLELHGGPSTPGVIVPIP